MKKITTSILLLILFAVNSQAQHWARRDASWHYTLAQYNMWGVDYSAQLISYEKDTVIQNKNCFKLSFDYFVYEENDTAFFWAKEINKFIPVYYFAANIGDTLQFHHSRFYYNFTDSTYLAVVDSVKNESISGQMTWYYSILPNQINTVFQSQYGPFAHYSEKIGAKSGFVPNIIEAFDLNYYSFCQYVDSTTFFGIFECNVGVKNTEVLAMQLIPNPVTDKLYVVMDERNMADFSIEVLDALGRKIKQIAIFSNEIDVQSLPKGIYFVAVKSAQKSGYKKFIKE